MGVFLTATGSFFPGEPVPNEALAQFPPNAIPLIRQKTGIESRHWIGTGQTTSDLAVEACARCLKQAGIPAANVDALICATSTPDRLIPATATRVAFALGANRAFAFDVNSVCSGGLLLLDVARGLIAAGSARTVLAVAADAYSRILDSQNFSTFPYFGDGAAAALVSAEDGAFELPGGVFHSDGGGYETITVRGGAAEIPVASLKDTKEACFRMDGRAVFDFAVKRAPEVIRECLEKCGVGKDDVAQFVLHQANINIIRKVAAELEAPEDKFFVNLTKRGNVAGASCLAALDEYLQSVDRRAEGPVVMAAFGGGLSWGGAVLLPKKRKD